MNMQIRVVSKITNIIKTIAIKVVLLFQIFLNEHCNEKVNGVTQGEYITLTNSR